MKTNEKIESADRVSADGCDVQALVTEITDSLDGATTYLAQQMTDYDTAFALWPGQSGDGRQWDEDLQTVDKEWAAFPWDGAKDTRCFYADSLIVEHVRVIKAALRRMRVQASALRGAGAESAQNVTTLLTWLLGTHKQASFARQLALVGRWRQHFGYAVLGAWWKEDVRVNVTTLRLDDLREAAVRAAEQTGDRGALALVDVLLNPAMDEQATALLQLMSPLVTRRAAGAMLARLRAKGECEVPNQEVISSLPTIKALRLFVDVFCPSLTDLQSDDPPRWMARRQWLTEAQLRSCAAQHEWDEAWVEQVLTTGRGESFDSGCRGKVMDRIGRGVNRVWWQDPNELEHLVEVVWHYRLGIDDDYDLPRMWLTVYCPAVTDRYAYHGPAESERYPFFGFVREDLDDATAESRGVAELAKGTQDTMKTELDNFANRASINSLPPLLVTAGALTGRTRLPMGPGVQIPIIARQEVKFLPVPAYATDSGQTLSLAEREGDRYFGRMSEHTTPTAQGLANEDLAAGFLTQLLEPMKYVLALMQTHLPPTVIARVTGAPAEMSKDDIQGSYDLQLVFNADDLNFELLTKKLEVWSKLIIPLDTIGATNRPLLLRTFARLLDRDLADQLIMDPQQASLAQVKETKAAVAQIMTGIEPAMKAEGENYALQLQVIEGLMQNPQMQKRLQESPDSMMLLQRFVQHLQFGMQQQQNADTGRLGVPPLDWRRDMAREEKRTAA